LRWRRAARSEFEDLVMPQKTHAELLLSKASLELSAIPKDGSQTSVSLASIDNYEVRMLLRRSVDLNDVPQFWLELFDHGTRISVDSFLCHQIKDAAPIFADFISHAAYLNKSTPRSSNEQ
jgi:hypothetical protein